MELDIKIYRVFQESRDMGLLISKAKRRALSIFSLFMRKGKLEERHDSHRRGGEAEPRIKTQQKKNEREKKKEREASQQSLQLGRGRL